MTLWLNKLFNIRPTEWPRLLFLFSLNALVNVGAIWGSTVAYGGFISSGGVSILSWIFVLSAALSVPAIAVYTAFADRISNQRLLIAIYLFGALSIALGLGLIWAGMETVGYFVLYLLFLAWAAVFNPHISTYISSFYDIQSAKRILPAISAGSLLGVIIAGFSLQFLNERLAPTSIIIIWLISYILAIAMVLVIPLFLKDQPAQNTGPAVPLRGGEEKKHTSFGENMREGLNFTFQSNYLRWMAAGAFVLTIVMALMQYRVSELLLQKYGTLQAFSNLLALLTGVGNLLVLPLLLFGLSRIIARLGLGNTSLIFPAGNLFAAAGVLFAPLSFQTIAAALGYLDYTALRSVFQYPVESLLYNAVPVRMKGRARAFLGGAIVPLGGLVAGVLLLIATNVAGWFIPPLIGLLALAYTITAFVIRRQYSNALVKMLEEEDYSFLLSQEAGELPMADPATLANLQKKLEDSSTHELRVFMTKLIAQMGGAQAIANLLPVVRSTSEARTRSAMVDVMVAAELRGERVRELYFELLSDPDEQVRQSAIAGLELLAGPAEAQFRQQMLAMVQDNSLGVSSRALISLVKSGDFYAIQPAVNALTAILSDPDPQRRVQGVRVLGKIAHPRALSDLLKYLDDPADLVRLEAALAFEEITAAAPSGDRHSANLQSILQNTELRGLAEEAMTIHLHDPVERIRQAALIVLARIGSAQTHPVMVSTLSDSSPQVRAAAVDALAKVGKPIIPTIQPGLNAPQQQVRKMTAVVLGKVDQREYGAHIVQQNIPENLKTIYRNLSFIEALLPLNQYRGIKILQSALSEQNRHLADEILYMLTALHDPTMLKVIGESLRSESSNARANAAEALEALTSPQIARLTAPLFEPQVTSAQLLTRAQESWSAITNQPLNMPDTSQAIKQMIADAEDAWIRQLTIYSLGEIRTDQLSIDAPANSRPAPVDDRTLDDLLPRPERQRRRPPANLFDALSDDTEEKATEPRQPSIDNAVSHPGKSKPDSKLPLTLTEIQALLEPARNDPDEQVRSTTNIALQPKSQPGSSAIAASRSGYTASSKEIAMLSTIDRIIFLKEVPFFQSMTIDQLKILASVCEEKFYDKETRIFNNGDTGGVLYVVVNGKVGIEQEKRAGSFARLADIEAYSYFGESNFFDGSPRSTSAVAIQDTLTLQLRREPLIALARQNPELALELINVLSQRLRETNDRIAELTKSRPRELHKLFDQYD